MYTSLPLLAFLLGDCEGENYKNNKNSLKLKSLFCPFLLKTGVTWFVLSPLCLPSLVGLSEGRLSGWLTCHNVIVVGVAWCIRKTKG